MLIDTLSHSLTPLLYLNCKFDLFEPTKFNFSLYAEYFNLGNSHWEPVVEENTLKIEIEGNKVSIVSEDPKKALQINLPTNLI